ncbi:hypothetical protein MRX96_025181 [Rhipicephalus microplus]|uniref:Serine palmitoyltransferase small subunit a n=4 Tax=Ixodidae TaxID=6939 RepID=A0A9D4QCN6_RHISA|nr:hypothetical protein HPB52_010822 [Rhipicephalus sanguineus]
MKSFLNRLYKKIKWYYFMYDLHTSLYMLESWEKRVFNIGLVAVVAMSSYTTYVFLPRYTQNVLRYFGVVE